MSVADSVWWRDFLARRKRDIILEGICRANDVVGILEGTFYFLVQDVLDCGQKKLTTLASQSIRAAGYFFFRNGRACEFKKDQTQQKSTKQTTHVPGIVDAAANEAKQEIDHYEGAK